MTVEDFFKSVIPANRNYLVAFADMANLLTEEFPGYGYAISIARALDNEIVDSISSGPNKNYLEHYDVVNKELSETVQALSAALTLRGVQNIPVRPTADDSELGSTYLKTLTLPFSHKMAATRAGLGWIGKTDLLVTEQFGPRIRLASVLLREKAFDVAVPIETGKCGGCSVCVNACPASAANGGQWHADVERSSFYDAFRCRKKCRELSMKNLEKDISLCGVCVSVCPLGMPKNVTCRI